MCSDFSDEPGVRGYLQDDADALVDTIISAHRSGWRVATHAIGDAAIDLVLDAYERCVRDHPRMGWGGRPGNLAPRHRIEHFGVARPDQVERAAHLGVVPVPQGRFVGEIGDGMRRALGPQRSEWAYRHARRCWRPDWSFLAAATGQWSMADPCWASTTWSTVGPPPGTCLDLTR